MKALLLAGLLLAGDLRLIDAVKDNDAAAVRSLIAQRVDIDATEADGSTALHWAAQRDNLEIASLLLAAGANAKAANRYNVTPLFLAATNGNAAIIERLLRAGADAKSTSQEGETALMTASLTGKTDAIRALVTAGADVNVAEPVKGQTALMWAASEGNSSAVDLLIELGADLKAKSQAGFTPLLFAVRNGHVDTVEVLLARGANVNDVAPDTTSALNMAVVNAYFELAAVLLDHGADPNVPDPRGSALHTLAFLRKPGADGAAGVGNTPKGPPPQTGNLSAIQLAKKLLESGADPNVRINWEERPFNKEGGTMRNPPLIQLGRHYLTYNGATPFYIAAHNGDVEYMRLLAGHGANANIKNALNITPLIVAAGLDNWEGETPGPFTGVSEAERIEAVKLAIELGNDVNYHADFGDYQMEGDPQYMLLYYPLNQDELSKNVQGDPRWSGSTALHASVVSGQPGITKFLLEQGARVDARTKLGWTALMMAEGIFYANARKDYPAAAALLRKAAGQ
ncbi:MAG TPA: ankyrin repeat domain-containing protein [Vicinamibacterales bacterium]|nr:ankyrin repeat domain-containing protein [Vicinamibacterales bacterium]